MIKTKCGKCGKEYNVKEEHIGITALCKACGNKYKITKNEEQVKPIEQNKNTQKKIYIALSAILLVFIITFIADEFDKNSKIKSWLIKQEIRIGERDKDGNTLMHLAAKDGRIDVMNHLLNKGEILNVENDLQETLVMRAAEGNKERRVDTIKWLINKGADYLGRDYYGWSVIHSAAFGGNVDVLEYFKNNHEGVIDIFINLKDKFGDTPLVYAKKENKTETIKWLIDNGAEE